MTTPNTLREMRSTQPKQTAEEAYAQMEQHLADAEAMEAEPETDAEDALELTPLGLIWSVLDHKGAAQDVADALELYLRRHGKAVAAVGPQLRFVTLEEVAE